jgi:hypothetical protein
VTHAYVRAESILRFSGDDPADLQKFLSTVGDARERLARCRDGWLDAAGQLSSAWRGGAQEEANAEIRRHVGIADEVLKRMDAALNIVSLHRSAVVASRAEISGLREAWEAGRRAYAEALATTDPVAVFDAERRMNDIGESWRSAVWALDRATEAADLQLRTLCRGASFQLTGLAVAMGVDTLSYDDSFVQEKAQVRAHRAEAGTVPLLPAPDGSAVFDAMPPVEIARAEPTPAVAPGAFPLEKYRAAVVRAALDDPLGFGKLAADEFAACTDFACVLVAAENYQLRLQMVKGASDLAFAWSKTMQSVFEVFREWTVGDCFDGNYIDCLLAVVPLGRGVKIAKDAVQLKVLLSLPDDDPKRVSYVNAVKPEQLEKLFARNPELDAVAATYRDGREQLVAHILDRIEDRTPDAGPFEVSITLYNTPLTVWGEVKNGTTLLTAVIV